MLPIGGLVLLFVCVFGTFAMSGGSIPALMEALPFEMLTIGGAAIGSLVMANSMYDVKHIFAGLGEGLQGCALQ